MRTGWRERLHPHWLTRDAQLLIAARVAMSGNRALAGVIVPIYLARMGISATQLGTLFAVTAAVSALLSAGVGLAADRLGRKPFIVALPLLTAAASVVFATMSLWPALFVAAALGSLGRGSGAGAGAVGPYQPAEQAYLADVTPTSFRNNLFGRIGFASSLGALIGGLLGSIPDLAAHAGLAGTASYRPAFGVAAALALAAGLLAVPIANRTRRVTAGPGASPRGRTPFNLPRRSWPLVRKLGVTNSVNGLAIGFFGPFITYWFYRRYGAGPAEIGLLYTVINLAAMVSNLSAAAIARRVGLVRAVALTRLISGVLLVPMVLAPAFWIAGGLYLLRMVAQRVGLPLRQSYVMGMAPPEERAGVSALSTLPAQATSSLGPAVAGYLFEHVALALPFEIAAALQALNAALYYGFFRHLRPPEERDGRRADRARPPVEIRQTEPSGPPRGHEAAPDATRASEMPADA